MPSQSQLGAQILRLRREIPQLENEIKLLIRHVGFLSGTNIHPDTMQQEIRQATLIACKLEKNLLRLVDEVTSIGRAKTEFQGDMRNFRAILGRLPGLMRELEVKLANWKEKADLAQAQHYGDAAPIITTIQAFHTAVSGLLKLWREKVHPKLK